MEASSHQHEWLVKSLTIGSDLSTVHFLSVVPVSESLGWLPLATSLPSGSHLLHMSFSVWERACKSQGCRSCFRNEDIRQTLEERITLL
jgi:hypothetical protein